MNLDINEELLIKSMLENMDFKIYDELFIIKFFKNIIDNLDRVSIKNLYKSKILKDLENSNLKFEIIIYILKKILKIELKKILKIDVNSNNIFIYVLFNYGNYIKLFDSYEELSQLTNYLIDNDKININQNFVIFYKTRKNKPLKYFNTNLLNYSIKNRHKNLFLHLIKNKDVLNSLLKSYRSPLLWSLKHNDKLYLSELIKLNIDFNFIIKNKKQNILHLLFKDYSVSDSYNFDLDYLLNKLNKKLFNQIDYENYSPLDYIIEKNFNNKNTFHWKFFSNLAKKGFKSYKYNYSKYNKKKTAIFEDDNYIEGKLMLKNIYIYKNKERNINY